MIVPVLAHAARDKLVKAGAAAVHVVPRTVNCTQQGTVLVADLFASFWVFATIAEKCGPARRCCSDNEA